LSAPLRVYWELPPVKDGGPEPEAALDMARSFGALKIFFLTVRLTGSREDIAEVLEAAAKGGIRITVSVSSPGSFPGWKAMAAADVLELVPADAASLGRLLDEVKGRSGKAEISVSAVPSRDNTQDVIEMFRLALGNGIRIFSLANPLIPYGLVPDGGAAAFVLTDRERTMLKEGLEALLMPFGQDIKLFVHDLFLHGSLKLPGLGGRIEYAGCQAGDAIAFIDGQGRVFPCATLPLPLGDMKTESLKGIWAGRARKELRERLAATASGCAGCVSIEDCKGGCRGIAYLIGGHESKDPGCGK